MPTARAKMPANATCHVLLDASTVFLLFSALAKPAGAIELYVTSIVETLC